MATVTDYQAWMTDKTFYPHHESTLGGIDAYGYLQDLFEKEPRGAAADLSVNGGYKNPNWPVFMQAVVADTKKWDFVYTEPWWEALAYINEGEESTALPHSLLAPAWLRKSLGDEYPEQLQQLIESVHPRVRTFEVFVPHYPEELISQLYIQALAGTRGSADFLAQLGGIAQMNGHLGAATYATERSLRVGYPVRRVAENSVHLAQGLEWACDQDRLAVLNEGVQGSSRIMGFYKEPVAAAYKDLRILFKQLPDGLS